MRINQGTRDYFAISDREDLSYEEICAITELPGSVAAGGT